MNPVRYNPWPGLTLINVELVQILIRVDESFLLSNIHANLIGLSSVGSVNNREEKYKINLAKALQSGSCWKSLQSINFSTKRLRAKRRSSPCIFQVVVSLAIQSFLTQTLACQLSSSFHRGVLKNGRKKSSLDLLIGILS